MKDPNSSEANDEHNRTLYVRLPHTIHNSDEVRDLFSGDINIKLQRQSARHCYVVFSTLEEKIKNLKQVKDKKINNKHIIARPLKNKPKKYKKQLEKKTTVPEPKPERKITQILYVTNINQKTRRDDIMRALGDCKSVTFLENTGKNVKQAIVRLTNPQLAAEYLKKERPWPVIDGNQLVIKPDTRKQKKKKPELKIWDGEVDITNDVNFGSSNAKKSKENNSTEVKVESAKKTDQKDKTKENTGKKIKPAAKTSNKISKNKVNTEKKIKTNIKKKAKSLVKNKNSN